ncbi:hypothetical protein RYJ27_05080 [Microbacterium limosum]|uniref:Aminobenzoate synthetase n=1 Tax=Microbacterium limosum TaxID=3079935 RepID=A0AAU0MKT5_9MICO|nr:hypothetical protein [Microbacterium sp. Y20]WOQ70580.1 hypothetical protein RYJ27_05080 [Microbacterium sp. Y20]
MADAAAAVLRAVEGIEALNPVILIDGRSGAGKSTLARALVSAWPAAGRVQLVALDSIYPGWDGLAAGVEIARQDILVPHARGLVGVWRRYDWDAGAPAEAHAVDPSLPLIVEGAGILTPQTARVADVAVWLDSPERSRRHRALARDGDAYEPHWERWALQEAEHIREHRPHALAHVNAVMP